jgi:homoserine dehydrogenase
MSSKVIVLKFGSSVLNSHVNLSRAVHEIYRWIRQRYRVVAVVSAFAGETDRLFGIVESYGDGNSEAIARVVATGEEVTSALLTLELDRFGIPAQALDPSQIKLVAEGNLKNSELVRVDAASIKDVLTQGRVAVIPGFVARDRFGHVVLLGRGDSDLSAVFLAQQLNARCRLIKDVEGVYLDDPRNNSKAQRFEEVTFGDALSFAGKVVARKAIAYGAKTGVQLEVAGAGENHATILGSSRSTFATAQHSSIPLKVGLLGLGTVGLGVFQEMWKLPRLFEVTGIAVRQPERHLNHAPHNLFTCDPWEVIRNADVVVELMGGSQPASDIVHAALNAGKAVVTANKLLLANDTDLGVQPNIRYSAAVGGAVPALEAVRALADDGRIVSLSGVLNGTCNYILDRIAVGYSREQAIADAQAHGFTEQDPRSDLSGLDTLCKLRLLARMAFPKVDTYSVISTGIDSIDPQWVQTAARDGSRVRLVGSAHLTSRRVHIEVKPKLIDPTHPFSRIKNEENCFLIETGEPSLRHVWTGRGAGRWPATAAVMADLFDLRRDWQRKELSVGRLPVLDQRGVSRGEVTNEIR